MRLDQWPMLFLEVDVFPWNWRLRPEHWSSAGQHQWRWLMFQIVWLP